MFWTYNLHKYSVKYVTKHKMEGESQMDNNFNHDNKDEYYNPYQAQEVLYRQVNEYESEPERQEKESAFSGFGVTLMKTVTVALVFGLVAGATLLAVLKFGGVENNNTNTNVPNIDLPQTNTDVQTTVAVMDVSDIVKKAMPSVVAISNIGEVNYQGFWGQSYTQQTESAGTGFLVGQDEMYLYIASNNHVVAGAKKLTVQFCDGTIADAEIKGTVASKDLAVIKVALKDISAETLSVIQISTLGDSTAIEVGEPAIAIGNALGYGQSVTVGYISALGRSVSVQDSTTGVKVVNSNVIQTDAAINPGNSGGALLNIKGEVIGINSVKYAETNVEGIGYAIPINDAMLIINKMIDGEKIDESQSGYLGIQGKDSSLGAYVHLVMPGSAAEKAGIKAGDIITEFEGTTIATMSQLKELLSYYPAGDKVEFEILRPKGNDEYEEIQITVELGDASILGGN